MMVATITSARMPSPPNTVVPVIDAHPLDPGAMIVDARGRHLVASRLAQRGKIERRAGLDPGDDHARHRQIVERQAGAEPGLEQLGGFVLGEGPDLDDAGLRRARRRRPPTSRSRSRPAAGRTWMVISLATSDCHSAADALTSSTAPVVIEARKVMMATTATSARPAIEARGTIGDRFRARAGSCGRSVPRSTSGLDRVLRSIYS